MKMFFYLKGTEPTQGYSSKDLEAVFKEDNITTVPEDNQNEHNE